jgi:hypothetical protein
MRIIAGGLCLGLALGGAWPALAAPPPAPIVFFDIAGQDMARQRDFYAQVFGWTISAQGAVNVPVLAPLPGSLRVDPPDKGLYIGVPDVTAALKSVVDHGGAVITPRFEVKGVAVLGLFKDPAGNGMGLVELGPDGKAKIP